MTASGGKLEAERRMTTPPSDRIDGRGSLIAISPRTSPGATLASLEVAIRNRMLAPRCQPPARPQAQAGDFRRVREVAAMHDPFRRTGNCRAQQVTAVPRSSYSTGPKHTCPQVRQNWYNRCMCLFLLPCLAAAPGANRNDMEPVHEANTV